MKFAGDAFGGREAFNKIVRTGGLDPFLSIRDATENSSRAADLEWWDDSVRQRPSDLAREAAWKQLKGNRVVDLNNKYVIGDATLPQEYGIASGSYEKAIVDLAVQIQLHEGVPPISAVAKAMRQIDPAQYSQGAPSQAAYLQRLADASRNPMVRKYMDIPENGEDEWGVLLSPIDAIRQNELMSRVPREIEVDDPF